MASRLSGLFMNCSNSSVCGVLTLENGLGDGYYNHSLPMVHGLWPETDKHGTSACVLPASDTPPSIVYPCYQDREVGEEHQLAFEQHEWGKHGVCAAVMNESDYFGQICSLSQAPLAIMTNTRTTGAINISEYSKDLAAAGFAVWDIMSEGQVLLSACADLSGRWKLGAVSDFPRLCGAGPPVPPVPSDQCVKMHRGPPCKADADCVNKKGCIRCAHSGFCTDVPDKLPTNEEARPNHGTNLSIPLEYSARRRQKELERLGQNH